ncbi:MAG: hypothetical protein QXJ32_05855 [Thermoplasmata archaeon]
MNRLVLLRDQPMARCSRCGEPMGGASVCPKCGGEPSKSLMSKTVGKAAKVTGQVLETGVTVTAAAAKEVKPVAKSALELGKKGVTKAKEETLKVAKKLKEEGG